MKVDVEQSELGVVDADLLVVGLFEDGSLPSDLAAAPGAEGAEGKPKRLSSLFPSEGPPVLVVGLGKRAGADAERLRVAAAVAVKEAGRRQAGSLAWALPELDDRRHGRRGRRHRHHPRRLPLRALLRHRQRERRQARGREPDPDRPTPSLADAAENARVLALAQNRARDLQSAPANFATPSFLAERAEEIAAGSDKLEVEVLGREQIVAKGMGGLAAVAAAAPRSRA